jgi:hypothetical protein
MGCLLTHYSLYPLFPVPRDLSSDAKINLDVTHMGQLEFDALFDGPDPAPDVLLLPSVVKHFHKAMHFFIGTLHNLTRRSIDCGIRRGYRLPCVCQEQPKSYHSFAI